MVSATGQARHREKFSPQMPGYRFVPYDDLDALARALDADVAAVIVEPIQGEGGVHVPAPGYLKGVCALCRANGSLSIVDEVQTGFCRTGPFFATIADEAPADLLTMAKGIAGGFPLGAFAMTEDVSSKLEVGDHGGTFCGNPLACAVACAVISYLLDNDVSAHVATLGREALDEMAGWRAAYPEVVTDVRGGGLLLLVELRDEATAAAVAAECLAHGVFVRQTQGLGIRVFPALTITREELAERADSARRAALRQSPRDARASSGDGRALAVRAAAAVGPAVRRTFRTRGPSSAKRDRGAAPARWRSCPRSRR